MPGESYNPNSVDAVLGKILAEVQGITGNFKSMRGDVTKLQTDVNDLKRFKYVTVIICSSAMVVVSAFAVAIAEHLVK